MKRFMKFLLVLVLLAGCAYVAYRKLNISDARIVVDIDKEYEEYLNLIYNEEPEVSFADQIGDHTTIDYPIIKTRFHDKLSCKVTYPDLKSYWLENQEELLWFTEEELVDALLAACETAEKKTITIDFPAEYDNGFLLLDSDCFEYQDAVSGGLLGLAAERYSEILDEMYTEVKE